MMKIDNFKIKSSRTTHTLSELGYFQLCQNQLSCQTPVLGLGLGVDITFALDNHNNHNNPHLNFVKGTVLGDKEQEVGIRDKG